jgi:UDP-2,3-diacylglucosamine pyrophosphatase LpxH
MLYIFNDIHIGDKRSDKNLELLCKTIDSLNRKGTIVLNGDCLDLIRCEKLDQRHFRFFDLINQFFNVIYIVGNHDFNVREVLKDRNFLFVDEFTLTYGGRRIKMLHGNQVDIIARKFPIVSKIVIGINSFIYKITGIDMERKIKKIDFIRKFFFNRQEKKLVKKYKKDFDCLASGHTHHCAHSDGIVYVDGVEKKFVYLNAGDWIDNCAYVVIDNESISLIKL